MNKGETPQMAIERLEAELKAKESFIGDLQDQANSFREMVKYRDQQIDHWKENTSNVNTVLTKKIEELAKADLQIDELKKDKEKITEGAIRFIQTTLCEEHHGRVQMQSPGEFIAEHDGKCVLCAFRLNGEFRRALDYIGSCDENGICECAEHAKKILAQYPEDQQPLKRKVSSPICGLEHAAGGVCERPAGHPGMHDAGSISWEGNF